MEFRKIPMLCNLFEITADGEHFRRVSDKKELAVYKNANQGYALVIVVVNRRHPEEYVLSGARKCAVRGVRKDGSLSFQLTLKVHQLVYDAWVGPVPDGMVIDHIDRNRSNNSVGNLRAITPHENSLNAQHRKPHDSGKCIVVSPNGVQTVLLSKDEAFRFIAKETDRSYRTVYNAFYSGNSSYRGYTIEMERSVRYVLKKFDCAGMTVDVAENLLQELSKRLCTLLVNCGHGVSELVIKMEHGDAVKMLSSANAECVRILRDVNQLIEFLRVKSR